MVVLYHADSVMFLLIWLKQWSLYHVHCF